MIDLNLIKDEILKLEDEIAGKHIQLTELHKRLVSSVVANEKEEEENKKSSQASQVVNEGGDESAPSIH